jgi:hypothetical protein
VGQAKRRHVLRYLAARERAGIIGAGPFDLDEALVRLDAQLALGCRWALAVAVELALTGQQPGCETCAGVGTAACSACRGSGHNIRASLPWPAWLRRKGQTVHDLRTVVSGSGWDWSALVGWTPLGGFGATCENEGERRVETRTRSFARGAHRIEDPWFLLRGRLPTALQRSKVQDHPAWLAGERLHLDQRRERARRRAGKDERARQAMRQQAVEDLLRGSLTTIRAATAEEPAEQSRLAVEAARLYAAGVLGVGYSRELSGSWAAEGSELERWHADVRDQADALGYGFDVLQHGTVIMSVDGALVPVTIADGVMSLDSGQRLTLMSDGSATTHVRSWHRRLQALGDLSQPVAVRVAVERDGPTE